MHCTLRKTTLIGLILLLSASVHAQVNFLDTDLIDLRKLAGQQGRLYFAVFTADWCMPCHWMDTYTFQDDGLADYVQEHYLATKVDIDEAGGQEKQQRFGVTRLPTIIVFNTQGQVVAKVETSLSADSMLELLRQHNTPSNRVVYQAFAQSAVMDSPKPKLRVYRPPLPAEYSPDSPPPSVAIPVRTTYAATPPASTPTRVPGFRSSSDVVAPRSHRLFSIEVGIFNSYEEAVRQVGQYESSFEQPVEVIAQHRQDGSTNYHLFIGQFTDLADARQMLSYMHRKNYSGVVKDLVAFKQQQKR